MMTIAWLFTWFTTISIVICPVIVMLLMDEVSILIGVILMIPAMMRVITGIAINKYIKQVTISCQRLSENHQHSHMHKE